MIDYYAELQPFVEKNKLAPNIISIFEKFYTTYTTAGIENGYTLEQMEHLVYLLVDRIKYLLSFPYKFDLYHERISTPFDYYQFGLDFIRPLINMQASKVHHLSIVGQIGSKMEQGDNVILFANHQTEPDPQVISLLLEKTHPKFAEEIIFVAGHRVISDPMAIPFSLGRNLLCIYSKHYVENPPELKSEKLTHNQRTMRKMNQLLDEGGKCIYVAPSGGRDRSNPQGKPEVAKFDPNSIEMFWLMAQKTNKMTHFYPLALATYDLLPPPNSVQKDLGEPRTVKCTPVHLAFGEEVDMEGVGEDAQDKHHRRKHRAEHIWRLVYQEYEHFFT